MLLSADMVGNNIQGETKLRQEMGVRFVCVCLAVELTLSHPRHFQAGAWCKGPRGPEGGGVYACVGASAGFVCDCSPVGSFLVSVSVSLSCERACSVHLKPLG